MPEKGQRATAHDGVIRAAAAVCRLLRRATRRLSPGSPRPGPGLSRHYERDEFPCHDCASATAPLDGHDEWYTVHDALWYEAGAQPDSILCIGCLENRLGRRLRHTDFVPAALNNPGYGHHSARLQHRLRPTPSSTSEDDDAHTPIHAARDHF